MKKQNSDFFQYFFRKLFNYSHRDEIEKRLGDDNKIIIDNLIDEEFSLTFGIVGSKGVGKSTTLKCLFGIEEEVKETIDVLPPYTRNLGEGKGDVVFYDFPGFGDLLSRKDFIRNRYDEYLPKCDVILWVFEAKSKVYELDEKFIREELPKDLKERVVIGLSQVDLVPPHWEWERRLKIPSIEQRKFIRKKKKDLSKIFDIDEKKIIPYCSLYNENYDARYNIGRLVRTLVKSTSKDKHVLGNAFIKETMSILSKLDNKLVKDITKKLIVNN